MNTKTLHLQQVWVGRRLYAFPATKSQPLKSSANFIVDIFTATINDQNLETDWVNNHFCLQTKNIKSKLSSAT